MDNRNMNQESSAADLVSASEPDRFTDGQGVYEKRADGLWLILLKPSDTHSPYALHPQTYGIETGALRTSGCLEICFPKSLRKISEGEFATPGYQKPMTVRLPEDHPTFRLHEDCLYQFPDPGLDGPVILLASLRDRERLELLPETTIIGMEAFSGRHIPRIFLPDRLREIHPDAFTLCEMEALRLPNEDMEIPFPKEKQLRQRLLAGLKTNPPGYSFSLMDQVLSGEYLNSDRLRLLARRLTLPVAAGSRLHARLSEELPLQLPTLVREKQIGLFEQLIGMNELKPEGLDELYETLKACVQQPAAREMLVILMNFRRRHTMKTSHDFEL